MTDQRQRFLARLVHHPHTPSAYLPDDRVVADLVNRLLGEVSTNLDSYCNQYSYNGLFVYMIDLVFHYFRRSCNLSASARNKERPFGIFFPRINWIQRVLGCIRHNPSPKMAQQLPNPENTN